MPAGCWPSVITHPYVEPCVRLDRAGKADLAWQCELKGETGEVVAVADCDFQIHSRESEGG